MIWGAILHGCTRPEPTPQPTKDTAAAVIPSAASASASVSAPVPGGSPAAVPASAKGPLVLVGDKDFISLAWRSGSGSYVVGYRDFVAMVEVGGAARVLPKPPAPIGQLVVSADGARAAAPLADGRLSVFDLGAGSLLSTMAGSGGEIYHAAFTPDGARVAVARDGGFSIHDAGGGALVCQAPDRVFHMAFTKDGGTLVTTMNGMHARHDAATCKQLGSGSSATGGTFGSTVSPDGELLASAAGDGHDLEVMRSRDFKVLRPALAHAPDCQSHVFATWSPDGKVLLGNGSGRWFESFEVGSYRRIARYEPKPDQVDCISDMLPDGVHIAFACQDRGRIEIVNAKQKKVACSIAAAGQVFPSPDSKRIAVVGEGRVRVYEAADCTLAGEYAP